MLQHIFDPFYKAEKEDGDGLGLSQIYSIINQHGGTIKVESQLGSGTAFKLVIPIKKKPET